jgi:hypothetical protein
MILPPETLMSPGVLRKKKFTGRPEAMLYFWAQPTLAVGVVVVDGAGGWWRDADVGISVSITDTTSTPVTVVVAALQDPRSLGPYGGMEVAFIQEEGLPPLWLPVEKVFAAVC